MTWEIKFRPNAESKFLELDKAIQRRILKFIDKLQKRANPRQLGESLKGELSGLWRYRVGDYRLICKIEDDILTILVVAIGHRKNIYK